MDSLCPALTALTTSVLAAAAVHAASAATAESEIFRPLRDRLLKLVSSETALRAHAQLHQHDYPAYKAALLKAVTTAAHLVHCAFCSSWWHAAWVAPVVAVLCGGGPKLVVLTYLGAVGLNKVLLTLKPQQADPKRAHPTSPSEVFGERR